PETDREMGDLYPGQLDVSVLGLGSVAGRSVGRCRRHASVRPGGSEDGCHQRQAERGVFRHEPLRPARTALAVYADGSHALRYVAPPSGHAAVHHPGAAARDRTQGGHAVLSLERCRLPSWMSPRRQCAPDRPAELLDELRELRLAGVEGRRHDDGVATRAADVARAGIDDEPVLERASPDRLAQGPLGRKRLARRAVAHELDPDQVELVVMGILPPSEEAATLLLDLVHAIQLAVHNAIRAIHTGRTDF